MRSREERLERAKSLGMTSPEYAAYLEALREDYHQALMSPSRLLRKVALAGGWPW